MRQYCRQKDLIHNRFNLIGRFGKKHGWRLHRELTGNSRKFSAQNWLQNKRSVVNDCKDQKGTDSTEGAGQTPYSFGEDSQVESNDRCPCWAMPKLTKEIWHMWKSLQLLYDSTSSFAWLQMYTKSFWISNLFGHEAMLQQRSSSNWWKFSKRAGWKSMLFFEILLFDDCNPRNIRFYTACTKLVCSKNKLC